jgi:hypothetical protein
VGYGAVVVDVVVVVVVAGVVPVVTEATPVA